MTLFGIYNGVYLFHMSIWIRAAFAFFFRNEIFFHTVKLDHFWLDISHVCNFARDVVAFFPSLGMIKHHVTYTPTLDANISSVKYFHTTIYALAIHHINALTSLMAIDFLLLFIDSIEDEEILEEKEREREKIMISPVEWLLYSFIVDQDHIKHTQYVFVWDGCRKAVK